MFDKRFFGNTRLVVSLGAALIACAPMGSQAADQETGKSIQLKVSDLDLNTDEGVRKLYRRIERASYAVCGSQRDDIDVIVRGAGPCVRETIAHTVQALSLPSLANVYIKENGADAARKYDISTDVRTAKN